MFNRKQKRAMKAQFKRDNRNWPDELKAVDRDESENPEPGLIEIWRSQRFLVQIYEHNAAVQRITVTRASFQLADDLSWDTLQRLKRECGRGDWEGVEIYPSEDNAVNVEGRHLWVFKGGLKLPFGFGTRNGKLTES
jgi:hypothetical protein